MLKQGLNCVKSRIREAAAQTYPESRPRPKTYSWTAAFVLHASFAVRKAGVGAQARAKSCQCAQRGAWKRHVLKQRLNYVKSRIGEAEVGA